jgi:hypothetical protein
MDVVPLVIITQVGMITIPLLKSIHLVGLVAVVGIATPGDAVAMCLIFFVSGMALNHGRCGDAFNSMKSNGVFLRKEKTNAET